METIQPKDREILRELARKQRDYAHSPENDVIMKKWLALGAGRRETPTVRLLFSNFPHEVITPRMRCEGQAAREIEATLLGRLVGRELFDDDTPIAPTYDISWDTYANPFGIESHITRPNMENPQGYHIDPVIEDLETEMDKLKGGSFGVDRAKTQARFALVGELLGDILPPRMVMGSINAGNMTNHLVMLMGMEAFTAPCMTARSRCIRPWTWPVPCMSSIMISWKPRNCCCLPAASARWPRRALPLTMSFPRRT